MNFKSTKANLRLMVLLIIAAAMLSACANLKPRTHTDQTGVILVEEPEVFTRERLVQDRRKQSDWLKAQLKQSYGNIEFGFQGLSDARRSRSIGSSTSIDQEPGGFTRSEEETQLESSNLQVLGERDAPPLPDPASAALSQAKSSPIDTFRDMLAYRDVIRSELLESQLDDRFDIHGNTLYMLNFDATIFPTHDTSSYAVIRVKVSQGQDDDKYGETYWAWISWWRERMQNELSGYLHDLSLGLVDLRSGEDAGAVAVLALNRLTDYAARELQEPVEWSRSEVSHWFRPQVKEGKGDKEKNDEERNRELAKNVEDLVQRWNAKRGQSGIEDCKDCSPEEAVMYVAAIDWLERRLNSSGLRETLKRSVEEREGYLRRSVEVLERQMRLAANREEKQRLTKELTSQKRLVMKLEDPMQFALELEALKLSAEEPDQAFLSESESIANLKMSLNVNPSLFVPRFRRGWKDNNIWVETNDNLAGNFEKGLKFESGMTKAFYASIDRQRPEAGIWAYAVTPKEQVERISDVAARRELRETLISSSFRGGNVGASQAFNLLDQAQGLWHSILRQPLVVGFGESSIGKTKASEEDSAAFGWIIGPRFRIQDDGKSADFRHRPVQNSLSAIVSVPAWWTKLDVVLETTWVGPKTHSITENPDWWLAARPPSGGNNQCCDWQRIISIPPDFFTIDEILTRPLFASAPLVSSVTPKPPRVVKSGMPATFIVKGSSLWRNTEVTLGAQRAEEIRLVPDMSAVEASFKKVAHPTSAKSEIRNLVLWTSSGSAWAGEVEVLAGQPSPKKASFEVDLRARTNQEIAIEIEHSKIGHSKVTDIEIGGQSATNKDELSLNATNLGKSSRYKARFEPVQDPGKFVDGKADLEITAWYTDKKGKPKRLVVGKAHVYPGPPLKK